MPTVDELFNAAQSLSLVDRWALVQRLWEALPDQAWSMLDEAEIALLDQRMADIESGKVETIPGDVVRRRLRERIQIYGSDQEVSGA